MNDRPSRLANLQELVASLSLSVQIQGEISEILKEYDQRIYSLEQDRARLLADYKSLWSAKQSLEKRYSELLYHLSNLKNNR